MSERRISVCYAAPGHSMVATAGSARNVLAVAEAMSEWADVTVAFRSAGADSSTRLAALTIDPAPEGRRSHDDVAARGLNPLTHLAYLRRIRDFAAMTAPKFDLVLEKSWRLSGYLARAFNARGTPAVLIENETRRWSEPVRDLRNAARYLLHGGAQAVAGACSRRLPLVIAETAELKRALVAERRIPAERIEVVGLGVDHELFRPMDQAEARAALGIELGRFVVVYVGGMDVYHDLSPLLEALRASPASVLELHLVGDGEYRSRYEEKARGLSQPVRFHGRVPHARVPTFIAAADLCLAPYQARGFHGDEVSFATLKIPEYMACARPVVSVPSGHILKLVEHNVTGFLFPNDIESWRRFLERLPARERLAEMGSVAAPRVEGLSWRGTARRYLDLCMPLVRRR